MGHLVARLFFRGIYFPQMTKRAWLKLIAENRRAIYSLTRDGFAKWRASRRRESDVTGAVAES
jgi:DNA-binding transcriptional regulator PaaX